MWNKFFEHIICMNLDKRQDRWNAMEKEFNRVGMIAERYKAFTENDCGGNRYMAYNHTYHGILSEGKGTKLVLEDDIQFVNNWPRIQEAVCELPEDWDVIYLGANLNGTFQDRYSENLCRIKNALQSYAIGYSEKMVDWILDHFDPTILSEEQPIYDEWLRRNVQPNFNCFVIRPMIAEQVPGYSDLWEVHADYSRTFADGNLLLL